ncbi:conserved hypothetical protein [Burkholderia vietnamiensis]|nr:conserved hypothetical protein [Burkholderia vietnamiensis]
MACISLNHHEAEKVAMRTRFSLPCVRLVIAFALACPFTSVCAQQRAMHERAVPAGDGLRHDGAGGFELVAAVEARSTDALSVTLWDELARPTPPPAPLPLPVDTQHAMAGGTTHRTRQ